METKDARRERFLEQLQRRQQGHDRPLGELLLERCKRYRSLDREGRSRHLREIDQMFRYFDGDMYGKYAADGQYVPEQIEDGDFAYCIPMLAAHVEQALSQLLKTQPEYEFNANDKFDTTMRALALMCEQLSVPELDRLFTWDMRQTEELNRLLAGESYRYLWWGPDPEHPKTVKRPKYRKETIEIPGRRECQACKSAVPDGAESCQAEVPGADGQTTTCGATFILDIPPSQTEAQVPDGEIDIKLGENHLYIPHPMSIQRDLSSQELKDSPFIIEKDSLYRHVAEWLYQTIISDTAEQLSEETRARRDLERSGVQMDGITGSARSQTQIGDAQIKPVERYRHWLEVTEYGDILVTKENEVLPDGTPVNPGLLGQQFPKGLFILTIGDQVLDVQPAIKNRKWSVVRYGLRPGAAGGRGLKALVPLNDIVNDDFNLDCVIKNTIGHPYTAVVRNYVKTLPEVGQMLFVDLPPNGDIESVIKQFPAQVSAGVLGAHSESILQAAQFVAGTFTPSGAQGAGAPDVKAMSTATGVRAITEQSSARMVGPIGSRVAGDFELLYQILENIRDYSTPEQRKDYVRRFGSDVARLFFSCNFRKTVTPSAKAGTDTPRSMALTMADISAFAQVAEQLGQYPNAKPILNRVGEMLGLDVGIDEGAGDRREAEYRLNKLRAIEEIIKEQNQNYLQGLAGTTQQMITELAKVCVPDGDMEHFIDPLRQDHKTFRDVYEGWLTGEESRSASDALKTAVLTLWNLHLRAEVKKALVMAEVQKQVAAQMQPAQPGPQADQAAQDKRALVSAAIEHQANEEAQDNQFRREQAGKDADLKRDLVKQAHHASTQMAVDAHKAQQERKYSAFDYKKR